MVVTLVWSSGTGVGLGFGAPLWPSTKPACNRCARRVKACINCGPGKSCVLPLLGALPREHGDGVVVSAINGRQETRVYGKPLVSGDSEHTLSDEEQEAVRAALDSATTRKLASHNISSPRRAI